MPEVSGKVNGSRDQLRNRKELSEVPGTFFISIQV
jgi:hypothetical protein